MFEARSIKSKKLLLILNDVFQASLIFYLVIILTEQFIPGFFSSYLNPNIILIIVIISGGINLIFKPVEKNKSNFKTKWYHYLLILFLGILGGGLIFLKYNNLSWLGYVFSVLSAVIIILVSYLILTEE